MIFKSNKIEKKTFMELDTPHFHGKIHFKFPFFEPLPEDTLILETAKMSHSSLCKSWLSLHAKTAPGKTDMCAKHALGTKQTQLGALWISDMIYRMQSNYVKNA